jgi:PBP1b-binding outer membrane lipoprotein LpoB
MKCTFLPAALIGAALLSGCAATPNLDNSAGRRVMYQDVASPSATVAGVGVESQDVVSMTDKMVRDILANPQISGRAVAPRVILDAEYFTNESSSRINKNSITDRMRTDLNRASNGRLVFVSDQHAAMVEKAREAKRDGQVDGGTIRTTKARAAADFRLVGRITSQDAASATNGSVSRSHLITFELLDLELGTVLWSNYYEFKKEGKDDIIYR